MGSLRKKPNQQKLIVWGDIQFHPWQENERPDRWKELVNIIPQVYQEAYLRGADRIIFLGDLFEDKRKLRTDIVAHVFTTFMRCAEQYKIPHHLLTGNHDSWNGSSILTPLDCAQYLDVVDSPQHINKRLALVPYGKKPPSAWSYTALFTHAEITGGNLGHGIMSISSTLPDELLLKKGNRTICFNGHYHHPQTIKLSQDHIPVICVGTPAELNWSDADSEIARGIVYVEVAEKQVHYERIPLNFPRFFNSPSSKAKKNDFVRNLEEQKREAQTRTHTNYDIIGGSEITQAIQGYVEEKQKSTRQGTLTELGIHLYNNRYKKGRKEKLAMEHET